MAEVTGIDPGAGVRPDPPDDRDREYPPRPDPEDRYFRPNELHLAEVFGSEIDLPPSVGFETYKARADPTWNQRGLECTGFSLAAIADFHLRKDIDQKTWDAMSPADRAERTVSRRMLYELAQEFDGRDYEVGSTLRGALKGWNRYGVACDTAWPYAPGDEHGEQHGRLTLARVLDAAARPSGPYWRIQPTDLRSMQDALARGYPLYACARLHEGWYRLYLPDSGGAVRRGPDDKDMSVTHAFVIVGYDPQGFWIHNSFGEHWAEDGYALIPYDQWAEDGVEVWVVTPPAPPKRASIVSPGPPTPADPTATHRDMWRHLVVLGDDGRLAAGGPFAQDVGAIKTNVWLFEERTDRWADRRLVIFADSGYWATEAALEQLRPIRDRLMAEEIYPLFALWETPWYTEVLEWIVGGSALDEAMAADVTDLADLWARSGGEARAKSLVATSVAPRVWKAVERRARAACEGPTMRAGAKLKGRLGQPGGARILAEAVAYKRGQKPLDLHLIGHGAGDLLLSELAAMLPGPITSCNLLAPATTMARFRETYGPMLDSGKVRHLTVRVLDEDDERTDRFGPLPGSLLQLVADVLAVEGAKPSAAIHRTEGSGGHTEYVWQLDPEPLLGMARFLAADPDVERLRRQGRIAVDAAPGRSHVGLADDPAVLAAMIADIQAQPSLAEEFAAMAPAGMAAAVAPAAPAPRRDPLGGPTARDPLSRTLR